jgi:hypothetical protein
VGSDGEVRQDLPIDSRIVGFDEQAEGIRRHVIVLCRYRACKGGEEECGELHGGQACIGGAVRDGRLACWLRWG